MSDRLCVSIKDNGHRGIYQVTSLELDILLLTKSIVQCFATGDENDFGNIKEILARYGIVDEYDTMPVSDLTKYVQTGASIIITLESMQFPPEVKKALEVVPGGFGVSEQLDDITGTPDEVMTILNKMQAI